MPDGTSMAYLQVFQRTLGGLSAVTTQTAKSRPLLIQAPEHQYVQAIEIEDGNVGFASRSNAGRPPAGIRTCTYWHSRDV